MPRSQRRQEKEGRLATAEVDEGADIAEKARLGSVMHCLHVTCISSCKHAMRAGSTQCKIGMYMKWQTQLACRDRHLLPRQ